MPRRKSKQFDDVQNARRVVEESTGESLVHESETFSMTLISQVMSAMGRKGGAKGGKRRLVTMTPERRREVATQAANARWKKAAKRRKKRA